MKSRFFKRLFIQYTISIFDFRKFAAYSVNCSKPSTMSYYPFALIFSSYIRLVCELIDVRKIIQYSRKGNPYDNACIEVFHSVLKKKEIYLHIYQDSKEARGAIFEYIEGWYNRKRIHSSIGYMTPRQKEAELKKQCNFSTFFV